MKQIILSILLGTLTSAILVFIFYPEPHKCSTGPFALKQNGDTLFLKSQLLHDTLVVIKTIEKMQRPKYDTTWIDFSGAGSISSDGFYLGNSGWVVHPNILFKNGATKDTIYENEIQYY